MKTLKELKREHKTLDAQIKASEKAALEEKEASVARKIQNLTEEEKEQMLSLINHDRSSCSDENPCNGFYFGSDDKGKWRCRKCMLMEIFNGAFAGQYDFKFSVDIIDVEQNM